MSDYVRFLYICIHISGKQNDMNIINLWFNRPTTGRNFSGEQKVNFESPVYLSRNVSGPKSIVT